MREASSSAWSALRRKPPPCSSQLDPFTRAIDQTLKAELNALHKQRHTVQRNYVQLIDEFCMEGISYSLGCEYVARRRPQIRMQEVPGYAQVFIPQSHRPGVQAKGDSGDVYVKLAGIRAKIAVVRKG